MPTRSYVLRNPWTTSEGLTNYQVHDARDGFIGRITGRGDRWEWETDLATLRIAQQLQGRSNSREAAQEAFKQAYEAWRGRCTDEQFDARYRRKWKL